ncbi:asparagine-rich protein-like isoform X2 [Argopecten irradians]|uniref:asparagine-rich protein-like isoform X2 n=1 Tax=Argopecten irradians TaxID=31199 RepID=UPI00371B2528
MGTYSVITCLLICAIVQPGIQQLNQGNPGNTFGDSTNRRGLSNNPVVDGSTNHGMGIGGSVFRLTATELNPNPEASFSGVAPSNVIQKDLKDAHIVHTFLDGGLQRMLMGSQSQTRPVVNQVDQITKMINSPKTINDAFPDQELVDGNAVAVGSEGTAVGASFKDPSSQVNNLPSAFTPPKNRPNIRSPRMDFSNHLCKGTNKENILNSKLYWVVIGEQINRMQCPLGTRFSTSTCGCEHDIFKEKATICQPDLINTFDYGMEETSGKMLAHFASPDLKPNMTSGVLCFNGSQKLGYPRYNGYDFRSTVYIVLRFKTSVEYRDDVYPLLTNSEIDHMKREVKGPSLGIILNTTNELEVVMETKAGLNKDEVKSRISFPVTKPNIWNTVTLYYDDKFFIASLNGISKTLPVTGKIVIRNAPLMIGFSEQYGYFDGCIDDIFIFHCIPNERFMQEVKHIV